MFLQLLCLRCSVILEPLGPVTFLTVSYCESIGDPASGVIQGPLVNVSLLSRKVRRFWRESLRGHLSKPPLSLSIGGNGLCSPLHSPGLTGLQTLIPLKWIKLCLG